MNKTELITETALKTGFTRKDTERVLNMALALMTQELTRGEDVKISGFGNFSVKERDARMGRNPKTGEEISIPASKNVQFKAGKALKDALEGAVR